MRIAVVPVAFFSIAVGAGAWAVACGTDGMQNASPSVPDAHPDVRSVDAGGAAPDAGDALPDAPSVIVRGGRLLIDGTPTFLYGGEIHYFRVRDQAFDAQKTQLLWKDSIEKMRAAHMNLVTTYLPWDYHAISSGTWDFQGARDVDAFFRLACDSGMKVVAKPGPLITGEWPRGFGTYGAVPKWWKEAHPGALVKKADGSTFTFSPTGDMTQAQPTYLHPEYLAAVADWFDRVAPILRKYIDSRCIVGVQVDNETNLYWSNRFGDVDYSATSVAHFRAFLASRYGSIAKLNAAYGSSYAGFTDVPAPATLPARPSENVPARDWYDAGQAYVLDYMTTIRAMLEARGISEPKILFFTNDSPFGIPTRNLLVHDGRIKNQVGLAGLDLYPKQFPTNGEISDTPFQADYFTKLFARSNLLYTKDQGGLFAYGAELQGGFYSFPLGVTPNVAPESTDQLLAKTIGHGLKGGAFYTMRGGINMDDSSYDFQASIALDGTLRPRYAVMKKWGALLSKWGDALEGADEVEDPVAIVQDLSYAVPQAGTGDDLQAMYTSEYNALFGWLMNAGFNPAVIDAQLTNDLSAYKAVVFLAPQLVDSSTASKLVAFQARGGVLIQMLDPGSRSLAGDASPEVKQLAALFPADANGAYSWPGLGLRSGAANQNLSGASGQVTTYWYETFWTPRAGSGATSIILERSQPLGGDGRTIAYDTNAGPGGRRAFVGGYVASVYNHSNYWGTDANELDRKRALARYLAGLAGVTPVLAARGVREEVWARRARGRLAPTFLFVVNDHDAATIHVDVRELAPLGLEAAATYQLTEALGGASLGSRTGNDLLQAGIDVPVARFGTAVVVLEPR